ncbi:MAG: Spy/CpxP family protein refolding chaperone [Acidobacteriia bacterium]|nr:Spy/CpxP family protein refolding chaperone [Terriglobia bacterium]
MTRFATMAALASGMMFAQSPAPSNPPQPPAQHRQWNRGQMFERMATKLNLTEDQTQQARSIWQAARTSSRPLAQQLLQSRHALRDAAKAGKSDADIDQLSANVGNLAGQMAAIRTKAFAKFYALLTPDQRTQADQMADHARSMFMGRHERAGGAGQ